jgi:hypothetical protein
MRTLLLSLLALACSALSVPVHAQLLTPVTAKEILPSVTSTAQSGFASDAEVTNVLFVGVEYQGVNLTLDQQNGKATGWVFRYYSASLDSVLFYVGVRVPIIGDISLPLAIDTLTESLPVSLGTTPLVNPWVDSDAAIAGMMAGGAADFYANNPDARIELAFLVNNPVQNEYIPQGQYWLFRNIASSDSMTCMVHAGSGQPFTCISGNTPRILTNPPTSARVGENYTYKVQAFGNPLPFYFLDQKPDGMSIDIRTGLITWTPAANQAGANFVILRASNDAGSDTQEFTINVQGSATEPTITSSPVTEAIADKQYQYQVRASGSPAPQYSLIQGPGGMVIDPNRGTLHWSPKRSQAGAHPVEIQAANSAGSDAQSFTLEVYTTPVIDAIPPQQARAKRLFQYTATADARPGATFTLVSGPDGLTVQTSGLIEWTPTVPQAGINSVQIKATNQYGFDLKTFTIDVDGTVGTDALRSPAHFRLGERYPNPLSRSAHTSLYVSYEATGGAMLAYRVFDMLGRVALKGQVEIHAARSGTLEVPVQGLKSGVYTLLVQYRDQNAAGSFTVVE